MRNTGDDGVLRTGLWTRGGARVPLVGVELEGSVTAGHARVRARQRYVNREGRPVEAVYVFPLPGDAVIDGFAMTCGGRRVEGVVQEREQAFRAYDDAVFKGHGAALLEQERPDVFTANVGNLLPGEETLVEVSYLQRLSADEGVLRLQIPTMVAPRYVPGVCDPAIGRTGHGTHAPTTRVPDADRITPPVSDDASYSVSLCVRFEMGSQGLVVESPSHEIACEHDAGGVRVRFARGEEGLDRNVVLTARGASEREPLVSVRAHRAEGEREGVVALTVVPDLTGALKKSPPQRVVFLVDTSGSMAGASLQHAKAALRLCLRQLREGDRFNVVEFNSAASSYARDPVVFTQSTLRRADEWVSALAADGGTELRAPLAAAVHMASAGFVVLLTDGHVGNEDEILHATVSACAAQKTRVYTLGIGANVSDGLLKGLARRTGAAAEFVHPDERIDEKVVGLFARALAPRVRDVRMRVEGVTLGERAPQALGDMRDGEPWTVFARYDATGLARAVLTGTLEGEEFSLAVPVELPAYADAPVLKKLWASERLRDLDAMDPMGRRADTMRARMTELALEAGIASRFTSFVVVERREGERRVEGEPLATRVVPVQRPAGWGAPVFTAQAGPTRTGVATWDPATKQVTHAPSAAYSVGRRVEVDRARLAGSTAMSGGVRPGGGLAGRPGVRAACFGMRLTPGAARPATPATSAPAEPPARRAPDRPSVSTRRELSARDEHGGKGKRHWAHEASEDRAPAVEAKHAVSSAGGVAALLATQLASGLFPSANEPVKSQADLARSTADALATLLAAGVTTAHPLYREAVRKAVEALCSVATGIAHAHPALAAEALAVAWLVASGRHSRGLVERAVRSIATPPEPLVVLVAALGDERRVQALLATS